MKIGKTGARLLQAVYDGNIEVVRECIKEDVDANTRDPKNGLSLLMIASGYGHTEMVELLLSSGADVNALDPRAGTSALHKACQRGSLAIVKLLVEAGAFVNLQTATTGHTPLIEAIWFKWPDIVEYLLEADSGLNLYTHYGFSLMEHFNYALKVTVKGKDKMIKIKEILDRRQESDKKKIESQKLMAAVTAGNLQEVKKLIQAGADLEVRYPILNGFNDGHTPLLVASRDGHTEIVKELLEAGANVNAVEPTFGAVPLHKATYNGHADITRLLVQHPGVDLDFQGPSNGYTPLLDALWHGFVDCAEILINAGARLDLRGHDGKNALDIALDVFGPDHEIVQLIRTRTNADTPGQNQN